MKNSGAIEHIENMKKLAFKAYEKSMAIIPDMERAAYFKGKFHACESILMILRAANNK